MELGTIKCGSFCSRNFRNCACETAQFSRRTAYPTSRLFLNPSARNMAALWRIAG